MSRHHSHISSAIKIIETAVAGEPLVHHLKRSFAADKKFGSKDRKSITALCYNYYRLGKALPEKTTEEKIIAGTFLCNAESNELLAAVAPELNEKIAWPTEMKFAILKTVTSDMLPFAEELSNEIDPKKFSLSFLIQPLLFLRIRPGKSESVIEKLTEAKLPFEKITNSCIALPQGSKTDEVLVLNKEAVVQDRNSQQVFSYLKKQNFPLPKDVRVWDCCAASGGKSILLYDLLHGIADLQVSDVRANILNNLRSRFKDAGIKKYHAFTADLTTVFSLVPPQQFDLIICDAPCTGSGTWARNPEQLSFFNEKSIEGYAEMQKKIASAALPYLKEGGLFFYITCSVFTKENEMAVEYLKEKFHLRLLQMEYLKGYEMQADTMFVAVLTK